MMQMGLWTDSCNEWRRRRRRSSRFDFKLDCVCVCVFALYTADICYVCVLGHTGCGSIFAQVRHVGEVGWVEKQFNLPSLHLLWYHKQYKLSTIHNLCCLAYYVLYINHTSICIPYCLETSLTTPLYLRDRPHSGIPNACQGGRGHPAEREQATTPALFVPLVGCLPPLHAVCVRLPCLWTGPFTA